MNEETTKVFEQLERTLTQLEKATQITVSNSRLEIDGTIQRFEFTIELYTPFLREELTNLIGSAQSN